MSVDTEDRLAPYASRAAASRGRRFAEPPSGMRTDFQRDRDRVLHSSAFRRLALKTQVFLPDTGDQYRTRLTHTIEVAQIARTIARTLRLNEDLTEALALAHDLGHAPFGHTGEEALDACLELSGGFDHNAQTLRIVTRLERRYPDFDGLNLTWESLEGLVKRSGPFDAARSPGPFVAVARLMDIDPATFASGEAQVAAIADDIAYNAHDLEDGLDAGLFAVRDLEGVPFLRRTLGDIAAAHAGLDPSATVRALTRRMVGAFVDDAVAESRRRLAAAAPTSPDRLRGLGHSVVALSPGQEQASVDIKAFLHDRMYRHPDLARVRARAAVIVRDLATMFVAHPERLASDVRGAVAPPPGSAATPRAVADHVASMTDRGAVREHRRFFGQTPDLR